MGSKKIHNPFCCRSEVAVVLFSVFPWIEFSSALRQEQMHKERTRVAQVNQGKQMKGMHTVAAAAQQGDKDTQFLFYEATMNEHRVNEHKEHEGVGYRG